MSLPETDVAWLAERGVRHQIIADANMTCVLIQGYELPPGYSQPKADLLLRLNPGYPDVPPDMWWFDPPVRLAGGGTIPATDSMEPHLGRTWQRWSRHFTPGQWQSGIDCLETFFALIRREVEKYVLEPVR